jgi:diguanylate cyclase (GGDEF)-like protein/PAS domain S-box-containing protein
MTTVLATSDRLQEADVLAVLDSAQTSLLVCQDGRIAYANLALAEVLDWPRELLVEQPYTVIVAPKSRQLADAAVEHALSGRSVLPGQIECQRRDGSRFDARAVSKRLMFKSRPAVLVTMIDTGDLSRALREAQWNASMLARTESLCHSGSFEIDMLSGHITPSLGLLELLGWSPGSAQVDTLDGLVWVPSEERAFVAGIWRNAVPAEPFEFQHRLCLPDGRLRTVLHRGVLNPGRAEGRESHGVAILQDITAQREAELRLEEVSNHNEVTGLPNRPRLLDLLDAATHTARWSNARFAVMSIEVARIAEVKASMGFGAGDSLTMALAARLSAARLDGETVAQIGDTEFAVLFESDSALEPEAMRLRAVQLVDLLNAPVRLAVTDIYPRAVIGIAVYPTDATAPADVLEKAQTARLGIHAGSAVDFFRPESTARAMRLMKVESGLRQALERNELHLVYQPQVDLTSGSICGAEALLRWTSPELGSVGPEEFIPVAERSGQIGAIGDWVLRRACEQAAAWCRAGLRPLRVGVNLSPAQLQRPGLAGEVQAVLAATGIEPGCLGIELTESMAMIDPEHAAEVLREIRAIGVEISLDDFGTGHSGLSCLRNLPIDVVKVDRSFVNDVTAAAHAVSVTRSIISLAHGLQMRVLVEGVETEGQLAMLAANRCDIVQGYWFSRPVLPADFEAMLRIDKRMPERFLNRSTGSRTLLLVDDEDNILASLKRLLRRDGYQIVTARSAEEGLLKLAEHDVDVIVSDQRMPGMSGIEFLRRAKDLYPETLRIALSGYTELQSIIDAVNEGAIYRFLTKPWEDERLRAHIAEAFRHKALSDENRRLALQVEQANADLGMLNSRLEQLVGRQREQAQLMAHGSGNLRALLDEMPAAVLGIDPDGMVVFANQEAERSIGCEGSLLGCPADPALAAPHGAIIELEGQRFRLFSRQLTEHGLGRLLVLVPDRSTAVAAMGTPGRSQGPIPQHAVRTDS